MTKDNPTLGKNDVLSERENNLHYKASREWKRESIYEISQL